MNDNLRLKIWNDTLKYCKQPKIQSPTDNSARAQAVADAYDDARQYLLESCNWGFAAVEMPAVRANLGQAQPRGYAYAYDIPPKLLHIDYALAGEGGPWGDNEDLSPNIDRRKITDFKILFIPSLKKNVLCCRAPAAIICGTYNIEDESKFTKGFRAALAYYIASEIAPDLTGDEKLVMRLKQEAGLRIEKAKYDSKAGLRAKAIESNSIAQSR
jgi:hypothetical protein